MQNNEDWLQLLAEVETIPDALNCFLAELSQYDVVNLSHRGLIGHEAVSSFTTASNAWKRHYIERGYDKIDPGVQSAGKINTPLITSFDPACPLYDAEGAIADMFDEAKDAIGTGAVCIHFHTRWGTNMVNIFSQAPGHQFDLWQRSYAARLALMAATFNEKVSALIGDAEAKGHNVQLLSDRERDCVAWLASGLRVSAIADKLGISDRTVEFHLSNARKKTNSPTRDSLIARVLLYERS